MHSSDEHWMQEALKQAELAAAAGEVPVGALVVVNANCVGKGFNQPISAKDPTAHAEIVALRQAAQQLGNYRLSSATLYVTLEPCTMCVGAMIHARVERLVFGAREPRAGAVCSHFRLLNNDIYNHRISYSEAVLAESCSSLLTSFFRQRRQAANPAPGESLPDTLQKP